MPVRRRLIFIQRRPHGSGRGLRCAATLARARKARLVVVEGEPRSEALLPAALSLRLGRASTGRPLRRRGGAEAATSHGAGEELDLLVKVAEPPWPALPWRLRTVDRMLLHRGPRPFWLLHPAQGSRLRVVLAAVGLDGRLAPGDARVLRSAASLARSLGGDLHVVLPWTWVGESILASPTRGLSRGRQRALQDALQAEQEDRLHRFLDQVPSAAPASVTVRKGSALSIVRDAAWRVEADVVVTGGGGPSGLEALLVGDFMERLALALPCSLLVVDPDGRDPDGPVAAAPAAEARPRRVPPPLGAGV